MSLIDLMMEPCVIMNKLKVPDGEGGSRVEWQEGAQILVAITTDTSMQARMAESDGVTSVYTLTTKRENALDFHDVIKRVSDGKIFRVTSDGADKLAPSFSSLNISQVSAERWSLTND